MKGNSGRVRHRHLGVLPDSMIGSRVRFGPPGDVKRKGGGAIYGTVLDEVRQLDDKSRSGTRGHSSRSWGRYCFFAQLIEWDDRPRSIRLGYFRKRTGEKHWEFASQTTVNSEPPIVRGLLVKVLAKRKWFKSRIRAS